MWKGEEMVIECDILWWRDIIRLLNFNSSEALRDVSQFHHNFFYSIKFNSPSPHVMWKSRKAITSFVDMPNYYNNTTMLNMVTAVLSSSLNSLNFRINKIKFIHEFILELDKNVSSIRNFSIVLRKILPINLHNVCN